MLSDTRNTDLAALRLLRLLYQQRSFSRVSESLNMSQSSVSYSINKLRALFDDPLFVRVGASISPTARCSEIVVELDGLLNQFDALLSANRFDPGQADTKVTISCNGYQRILLLRPLLERLNQRAPKLRVRVLNAGTKGRDQLQNGDTDLLICPIQINNSGFYERDLIQDDYVCVLAADNPLAARPLTMSAYLAAEHLTIFYGDNWQSPYLDQIEASGHRIKVALEVPSLDDVARVIPESNLIATVPRKIAAALTKTRPQTPTQALKVLECPIPSSLNIALYWTSRTHHSELHRWLRSEIAELTTVTIAAAR